MSLRRMAFRSCLILTVTALAVLPLPSPTLAQDHGETQFAYSGVGTAITLRMPGGVAPYTHTITTPPRHGTLEVASATVVLYTSTPGYTGNDSFAYTMVDARGASRRATVTVEVVTAPASAPVPAEATARPPMIAGPPQPIPNEYVLHYRPGTSAAEVKALVAASGGTIVGQIPELNAVAVRLPQRAAVSALGAEPDVLALEPNPVRRLAVTPDDPSQSSQWSLNAIHVYNAWDAALGTGQIVAILDTGSDLDHPDLAAHLQSGYDFVDDDGVPAPDPAFTNQWHGTHVNGIANAVTNNGTGIAGVAWDARTLPVRIVDGEGASSFNIANGIVYATDHGAQVINLSLAGAGWVKIERDAVNYAAAHGVIVVAAAGNDGDAIPFYPASYDHVISVASTTSSNGRSSFSNYGPYIDIAAPGSYIYSTLYNNAYGYANGTSMATPHAAGVVALVWSAGHATTAEDVTEALLCSALDLGAGGWDPYFGWGLVQADSAVNYIPGTNACLPTVAIDDFDSARPISWNTVYSDTLDISHATSWVDDPAPCAGETNRTVWYRFDAPWSGKLQLDTLGSTYDTVLSAYSGSRGFLTMLACNDDASGTTSALSVGVDAGQSVYVMVSSPDFETDSGTLTLHAVFDYTAPSECHPIPGSSTVFCTAG
ncbi:MAG TPA: S8 family serine peptidase [Aggregatilineaceae bacterium]|nr:S8 family serine peptidase [Aggregatilineaceae bacterium]